MAECIKPYLYKRRKNALIRPFNSTDKNKTPGRKCIEYPRNYKGLTNNAELW